MPVAFAVLATITVLTAINDADFGLREVKELGQGFRGDNIKNNEVLPLLDIIQKQEQLIHKQEAFIKSMDRKLEDHDKTIKDLQNKITSCTMKSEKCQDKSNGTLNNQRQLSDKRVDSDDKLTKRLLSASTSSRVAFSVYSSHAFLHMNVGTKLLFDRVYTNDGNAYDTSTGVFRVPRSGVYLLTYTIDCQVVSHPAEVELVVNGASYGSAKAEAFNDLHHVQSTKTIILHLAAGQLVWLQTYWEADSFLNSGNNNRFATFSGVLLY